MTTCSTKDKIDPSDASVVQTKYWHECDDEVDPNRVNHNILTSTEPSKVQCDLCPRYCKLHEGQRGLCYVRGRVNNAIVLTTYGRSSGFAVDPIEKKPLNHFYPGSSVLSFGTAGCNLACKFCQNWDISKSREMDTVMDYAMPAMIAKNAQDLGCKSVAYTYNDPTIYHEYAIDTAEECRKLGIKNVAVTAGYMCEEPRKEFFSFMDAVNVDLKAFTDDFYWKQTGAHLEPVLDTLKYIKHETNVWLEITTLIIPGLNDSSDELKQMSEWVVNELGNDIPMHFSAFHPDYKMTKTPHTPQKTLTMARKIAMNAGVRYAYTGNVHDEAGGSTFCHQCGANLISRDWYQLGEWNLSTRGNHIGICNNCGASCAGFFEATPGNWGANRRRVVLR